MIPRTEASVLEGCIRLLRQRSKAKKPIWWLKVHGSAMQRAGVPDLQVLYYGRFRQFELKRPGETATPRQLAEHEKIRTAGGDVRVIEDECQLDSWLRFIEARVAESG